MSRTHSPQSYDGTNLSTNQTGSSSRLVSSPSRYSRLDTFSTKPRFDDDANFRAARGIIEQKRLSNLGPGSYDDNCTSFGALSPMSRPLSSKPAIVHKSHYSEKDPGSYRKVPCSPPVGTYNLPPMIGATPPRTVTRVSSSFRSSGRKTPLFHDGQTYRSSRESVDKSNIGPGYYDQLDTWNTAQEYVRSANYLERQYSPETVTRISSNNDENKPWRLRSDEPDHTGRAASKSPMNCDSGTKLSKCQMKVIKEEIDSVRTLPLY